jgi:hypothetical protein
MSEQIARYKPGDNVPGFASTAVLAGRFVSVQDTKTANGDYPIAHAAAGSFPFGVAEADSAAATEPAHSAERRVNVVRRGAIARVTAGEALTAPQEVMVGTGGKAVGLADVAAAAATLATGVVGSNNAITWTAKEAGTGGNALSVTIIDPAGNNVALSVDVDQEDIVVTLATDGASAPTSTATEVMAAVNEHDLASQLVDVASTGASNGTGVVAAVAETALAGGTDESEGVAVGRVLTDADTDEIAEVDLY